jgi:hypothetical protein
MCSTAAATCSASLSPCRTSGAAGAAEVLNHPMSRWSAVRRFADEPSEEHRKIFLASRRVQERLSLAD